MNTLFVLVTTSALLLSIGCESVQRDTSAGNRPFAPGTIVHPDRQSGEFDTPPKFVSGSNPIYPISQLMLYRSGEAVVSFVVNQQGQTTDFRVIRTTYSYFASHAIHAIREWKFEPARKNGKAVAVRIRVPFKYVSPTPAGGPPHV